MHSPISNPAISIVRNTFIYAEHFNYIRNNGDWDLLNAIKYVQRVLVYFLIFLKSPKVNTITLIFLKIQNLIKFDSSPISAKFKNQTT